MAQPWTISDLQRNDLLVRMSASISGLALSRGQQIPDGPAYDTAVAIERKAFTAAQVSHVGDPAQKMHV